MNKEAQERADSILEEYFAGGLSAELDGAIQAWFVESDNAEEKENALFRIFDRMVDYDPAPGSYAYDSYRELEARLGLSSVQKKGERKEPVPLRRKVWFRVAAVLLPVALVAGAIYLAVDRQSVPSAVEDTIQLVELTVPAGGETQEVTFSDGSHAWVEAGSTIRYERDFVTAREVSLTGEAFFDVQHLADNKPFLVKTDRLTVTVLGTRFNVDAAPGQQASLVKLESGTVMVGIAGSDSTTTLEPGDELTFNHETGAVTVAKLEVPAPAGQPAPPSRSSAEATPAPSQSATVQTHTPTSSLSCADMSIDEIFKAIENHYGVKIEVNASLNTKKRYSISFPPEHSVDQVMSTLSQKKLGGAWAYQISGNKITVAEK